MLFVQTSLLKEEGVPEKLIIVTRSMHNSL